MIFYALRHNDEEGTAGHGDSKGMSAGEGVTRLMNQMGDTWSWAGIDWFEKTD